MERELLREGGDQEKNLLLALLAAAHSLNHSLFLVLPLYLSTVAWELSSSLETIGLVAALSGFIYGAGSLVGGSLADRIGELKTIIASSALAGTSSIIFLAAYDLPVFALGLVLMGAWASLYHPTANSIISKVFQSNMAEAMGLHGTGGNIGYMFAPIVTVVMGDLWGWRIPLLFFGLLSTSVSILMLKWSRVHVERDEVRTGMLNVFKTPGLPSLLLYNVLAGLYFKGVEFMFPTLLEERVWASSTFKGVAVFGIFAAGILGQWIGGRASDSLGSRKALIAASLGVSVSLGVLILLMRLHPLLGVSAFVLMYGICFYGHQPALNSLAGLISPNSIRGTMYGLLFFFGFGLGSASTFISASVADRYSVESAFYVMIAFSVAALLVSMTTPKPKKSSQRQARDGP